MADKQHVLTSEGLKKLQDELEELKSVKRREIADKIKVALSFGDLSENSEYDEAKNEQGMSPKEEIKLIADMELYDIRENKKKKVQELSFNGEK